MELHTNFPGAVGRTFIPAGMPGFDPSGHSDHSGHASTDALSVTTSVRPAAVREVDPPAAPLIDLPLHELRVRVAKTRADMEEVAELRCEIDLAAAMAADPRFLEHEKKEKKSAFRSRSTFVVPPSAP
jgi:hypothetical protein